VLNFLELKMNLCFFSFDIWIDIIIALKQHNLSVERYINHSKVSNQHYLKLNVDQYFKSIDSIDLKWHWINTLKSTPFCFLYFVLIFISVWTPPVSLTILKYALISFCYNLNLKRHFMPLQLKDIMSDWVLVLKSCIPDYSSWPKGKNFFNIKILIFTFYFHSNEIIGKFKDIRFLAKKQIHWSAVWNVNLYRFYR
jgi:hypothetical protein